MKNKIKQLAKEQKVKAADLIEELSPLVKEYFEGSVNSDGDKILYNLYNGQKFVIKVEEVFD